MQQPQERIRLFRELPAADYERLAPTLETRTLGRGEGVWRQGQATDSFDFVVRGHVKLVKSYPNGRRAILEVLQPSDLLCGAAVCMYAPYCCTAVAGEDGTEVTRVPRRALMETLERSPAGSRAFLGEIACRGVNACQRVEELSAGRVEQRIATLLLRLAERAGSWRDDSSVRVPVPLTRQDIAELCGTTLETAIRVMSRLSKEQILGAATRGILIRDIEGLRRMATGL